MNLLNPNTDRITNFYDKGKYIFAWRLIMLIGFSFLPLAFIAFFYSNTIPKGIVFIICVVIAIFALLYLKKTKKSKTIYYIIVTLVTSITCVSINNIQETVQIQGFLWLALIVMFTFFGLGKKAGLIVTVLIILNTIYYFLFSIESNTSQLTNLSLSIKISLIIEIVTIILSIAILIYQFVIIHDHTNKALQLANKSLLKQNEIISDQNKENRTLVQEVHHRVKNNLQIIISLLRLQKNDIKNPETQKQFSEAINRVMVMSSIHQKLYKDESLTNVNITEYITDLTNEIKTLSINDKPLTIHVKSEINSIGLKTIVPLGLIINELASNSIQHAFTNTEGPQININITEDSDNQFTLYYTDNGVWKSIEEGYSSFGLELLEILSSQLDGHYKRESTETGTNYIFVLKI